MMGASGFAHRQAVRLWYGEGGGPSAWLKGAAIPLAGGEALYRLGLRAARALTRRQALTVPVPVISVGNLAVGGAGKSPLCLELARRLRGRGVRPVVVSHSHGRTEGDGRAVLFGGGAGESPRWQAVGDEAVMMHREDPDLTVAAGGSKPESLRLAVTAGAGAVILDDAFHRRDIARDLDLVVLDGGRGLGNCRCLPRGPLREPPAGLARADGVVVTLSPGRGLPPSLAVALRDVGADLPLVTAVKEPAGLRPWGEGVPGRPATLSGLPVFAFCGVGNPASFRDTLAACGADIRDMEAFPDHHPYGGRDMERLARRAAGSGAAAAVTTAKDAVRVTCWPGPVPLLELRMRLVLGGDTAWLDARLDALAAKGSAGKGEGA